MQTLHSELREIAKRSCSEISLDAIGAVKALLAHANRVAVRLTANVRSGILPGNEINSDVAVTALLTGNSWGNLNQSSSFLSVAAQDWANFTEPQITAGWVHYLSQKHRVARCQAFFDAAWEGSADGSPQLATVELLAAELGRIDLLIIGRSFSGNRIAVCVEAKFGHVLTGEQLRKYERKLRTAHKVVSPNSRRLLVVAPSYRWDIATILSNERDWQFCSWVDWLVRYDNALPEAADDDAFKSFRHTVLVRAKSEMNN